MAFTFQANLLNDVSVPSINNISLAYAKKYNSIKYQSLEAHFISFFKDRFNKSSWLIAKIVKTFVSHMSEEQ